MNGSDHYLFSILLLPVNIARVTNHLPLFAHLTSVEGINILFVNHFILSTRCSHPKLPMHT